MACLLALVGLCTTAADTDINMNEQYDEADLRRRFDSLGSAHPRLCTRTDTLPGDLGDLEPYMQAVIAEAHRIVKKPVLERVQVGRRLLAVSRDALHRLTVLSAAWMRTHDEGLLRRAEAELLALCAFSDWNPSHYLDTAEMSLAVSLGYDWLYNALPPESREKIADGLWRLGLQTALDDKAWWTTSDNNWGQVCHAGMTAAALVLADRHPPEAFHVVNRAFQNIGRPMSVYAPDGVYPEGPGYWDYGTSFTVAFIQIAESALGTSYGLDRTAGFVESADFMRHVTGSTGWVFDFADCGAFKRGAPCLLWFADRYPSKFGGHASGAFQREWALACKTPKRFSDDRLAVLFLLFGLDHPSQASEVPRPTPLDWHGRGESELVTLRSAWDDPAAWYVGIKSGTPSVNHGHMDGGSFILEAGGVRWAHDAGAEDYHSIEARGINLWNKEQDGMRWSIFRYGNLSHNIPVVNGERQRVFEHAHIVEARINNASPHVKVDLSALYGKSAVREFVFSKRTALTITDTLSDLAPGDVVRWQMLTQAKASARGRVLTLTQDGRTLTLTVDADVVWKVTEAHDLYQEWDNPQEDMRVVSFERPALADGILSQSVGFAWVEKR